MVENVKEFQDWGPLGVNQRPLKEKKGQLFAAFIQALRALAYHVDWRVMNAADFGDPTCRRRLFILCRKHKPIQWPKPTHAAPAHLGPGLQPWRTAREIIDWDLKGTSIFQRKKPLRPSTLKRILTGLQKFNLEQPFIVQLRGTQPDQLKRSARSIDEPVTTITAGGNHIGLVNPFLIHTNHQGGNRCYPVTNPVPTVTAAHRGELALVEPRIIQTSQGKARRLKAVLAKGACELLDEETCEKVAEIDVLLRMLQPHELAAAMGFPKSYEFLGTKEERVRQIGNAVPVGMATEMIKTLLSA